MGGPGSGGNHGGGRHRVHAEIIKTQVNLTPETRKKLEFLAGKMDMNNSEVVRWLIANARVR